MAGPADQRDHRSWVVLELTRQGEVKSEEGVLAGLLRECLRVQSDWPVFVPSATYYTGGRRITLHLLEGYAFVASGLPDVAYFALERTPYVRSVLTTRAGGRNAMRTLSVVPESSITEMQAQLAEQVSSDVTEGMRVTISDGVYTSLSGDVVILEGDSAHVRIQLRSLDLIVKMPRVFLSPSEEGEP